MIQPQMNIQSEKDSKNKNIATQEQGQQKGKQANLKKFLSVALICFAFITIGVFACAYLTVIKPQRQCSGRNTDVSNECNCLKGYYKSGKDCAGPFNQEIFEEEEILHSLLGQDMNVAPRVSKRYLSQVYHYNQDQNFTSILKEDDNKVNNIKYDYEINVVTEDVGDNEFTAIIYLKEQNYTVDGQLHTSKEFPPQIENITHTNNSSQQTQENISFEGKLSEWQKEEAQNLGISYQQYYISMHNMIRISLGKDGKINQIEVPVNLPKSTHFILLNFLQHYAPKLQSQDYQVNEYLDENGEEILQQQNNDDDIVLNKYTLLEENIILEEQLQKKTLSNKQNSPNHNENIKKQTDMINGQMQSSIEDSEINLFHSNPNNQQLIQGIVINDHVECRLKEMEILSLQDLQWIQYYMNEIKSIEVDLKEYTDRLNKEDDKIQKDTDETGDNDRRMLLQGSQLFNKLDLELFNTEFLGMEIKGGNRVECVKSDINPEIFSCQFEPYANIFTSVVNGIGSANFDVNSTLIQEGNFKTTTLIDKTLYSNSISPENGPKLVYGLKLFTFKFEVDVKVSVKAYLTVSQDRLFVNNTLAMDVDLTGSAGPSFYVIRFLAEVFLDAFNGRHQFTIDISNDVANQRMVSKIESDILLQPVKSFFSIYFQHQTIETGRSCINMLLWEECHSYPVPVWSKKYYAYGPKYVYTIGETIKSHLFGFTFYNDNRQGTVTGDQSQLGSIKKLYNYFGNKCKTALVQSAGFDDGNIAEILINGQQEPLNDTQGIHLIVYDFETLEKKDYKVFQTGTNQDESTNLINYIQIIAQGDYIAVVVKGDGGLHLSHDAKIAIQDYLGISGFIGYRSGYAAFTQQGKYEQPYVEYERNSGKTASVKAKFCESDVDFYKITSVSKSERYGGYFTVYKNDEPYEIYRQREGTVVAVLDPETFEVKDARSFSTHRRLEDSNRLIDYVKAIKIGEYVAYGINKEGALRLTDDALGALENNLGFDSTGFQRDQNTVFAGFGIKGMKKGDGLSLIKGPNTGKAMIWASTKMAYYKQNEVCKQFEVSSQEDQNHVQFLVNNIEYEILSQRGIFFIVYDEFTLEKKLFKHYDPHVSSSDVSQMIQFINDIANGDFVLFAVKGTAATYMNSESRQVIQRELGISHTFAHQQSFAAISQKGQRRSIYDSLPQGSLKKAIVKANLCNYQKDQFIIESQTSLHENYFQIYKDGSILYQNNQYFQSGLSMVVFDQHSHQIVSQQTFFTGSNIYGSGSIIDFIGSIPQGQYVAYGVKSDASQFLDDQIYAVLEQNLGYDRRQYRLGDKDSMVAWSRKGQARGTATIIKKSYEKKSSIMVSSNTQMPQTRSCKKISLSTSGINSGNYTKFFEDDNQEQIDFQGVGVKFYIFDQNSLKLKTTKLINPGAGVHDAFQLKQFIHEIFPGDFVAISIINDDINQNIERYKSHFNLLGINLSNHVFQQGDSLVAIGQMGSRYGFYEINNQHQADISSFICQKDTSFIQIVSEGSSNDGSSSGNFQVLHENRTILNQPAQNGLNIAIFNKDMSQLKEQKCFVGNDTQQLAETLASIQEGDLVAYGIKGDAAEVFSQEVERELEYHLGYNYQRKSIHQNDSLVGFVRYGMELDEGSVLQKHAGTGKATIIGSVNIKQNNYENQIDCREVTVKSRQNWVKFHTDGIKEPVLGGVNGVYFIVYDKYSLQKTYTRSFDTHGSELEVVKMVGFIRFQIQQGDYVLIAFKNKVVTNFNQAAYKAFELLGIYNYQFLDRHTFAAFAQKGYSQLDQYAVYNSSRYFEVNIKATICPHTKIHINVQSETVPYWDTNSPHQFTVKKNNEVLFHETQQVGFVIVAIDQHSQQLVSHKIIDTTDMQASQNIMDFISLIRHGDFVAYGISRKVDHLDLQVIEFLEQNIGFDGEYFNFIPEHSMSALSRKGSKKGEAIIQMTQAQQGMSIVTGSNKLQFNKGLEFCKDIYIKAQRDNMDFVHIFEHGVLIQGLDNQAQINIAVIDSRTINFKLVKNFNQGQLNDFIDFIQDIQTNDFVAITIRYDAILGSAQYTALQQIGIQEQLQNGNSLAALGQKKVGYKATINIDRGNVASNYTSDVFGKVCSSDEEVFQMSLNTQTHELETIFQNQVQKVILLQGINLEVFDKDTKQLKNQRYYNKTNLDSNLYVKIFNYFIDSLNKGDFVVYSFYNYGSGVYNSDVLAVLENQLGYDRVKYQVKTADHNIFWARVGMSKGQALGQVKTFSHGPVYLVASLKLQEVEIPYQCKTSLAKSGGQNDGNFAKFFTNGEQEILEYDQKGIHFIVYDRYSVQVKSVRSFDVSTYAEHQLMIDFIENLMDGDYVKVAVKGDAHQGMNHQGWDALKKIGIDRQIQFQESFAAFGRKGQFQSSISHNVDGSGRLTEVKSLLCPHDKTDIEVISKANHPSDVSRTYFEVRVNGHPINTGQEAGLHMVVLHPETLEKKYVQTFFYGNTNIDYTQKLVDFIDLIPIGYLVAYGVCDDISAKLEDSSKKALQNHLGYDFDTYDLQYEDSMAALARKGQGKGQALIQRIPAHQGVAIIQGSRFI